MFEDIYQSVKELKINGGDYSIHCNYIEIYNEDIFDLLSPDTQEKKDPKDITNQQNNKKINKKKVKLVERDKKFIIQDVYPYKIIEQKDLEKALEIGNLKRETGTTNLNKNSSRSHTIFKIIYKNNSKNRVSEIDCNEAAISIVDLAGSERATNAGTSVKGKDKELQETRKINSTLMILGRCFEALKYNSNLLPQTGKEKNIPFRECALTKIFQEFLLNPNQNIRMITNINPSKSEFDESIRALSYACKAREIKPVKSKIVTNNYALFTNRKKKTLETLEKETLLDDDYLNNLNSEIRKQLALKFDIIVLIFPHFSLIFL